jgi:hypothetical protein
MLTQFRTAQRTFEEYYEGKPINSCDVDPPFLHVDPLGKRAINVRA